MLKLVKGGKTVFGWTRISSDGFIHVPPEAVEEYEFHLRCLQQGYKFVYLSQVVVNYRIWPSSKSVQYRLNKSEAREKLISSIREKFR